MKALKKMLTKNAAKFLGSLALLIGALAIVPASTGLTNEPKCPDELLK